MGKEGKTGRNLLKRLISKASEVLAFTKNQEVPFTNNEAERDIRMIKVKQKIAGSFRKTKGGNNFLPGEKLLTRAPNE